MPRRFGCPAGWPVNVISALLEDHAGSSAEEITARFAGPILPRTCRIKKPGLFHRPGIKSLGLRAANSTVPKLTQVRVDDSFSGLGHGRGPVR